MRPAAGFSIRFSVEPGQAVYLGNFEFKQTRGPGAAVTGVEVMYQETMDRDLQAFRRNNPGLAATPVTAALQKGAGQARVGGSHATRFAHAGDHAAEEAIAACRTALAGRSQRWRTTRAAGGCGGEGGRGPM